MTFPKTPKGLSSKISRIRSQLTAFKREHGCIDDSSGSRYYLFYLYFLLGDNRRSSEYIRWYERELPDDMSEPLALLCWSLMLNRMGKDGKYRLARTMLSNIYLIPFVLDDEIDEVDMYHSSDWHRPDYLEYLPETVLESITSEDQDWIREHYESTAFQKILRRHIAIEQELENTPVGDVRSTLVNELYELPETIREGSF